jgi:hypothetical protein
MSGHGHGHGDVYDHDHPSSPCQARGLALEQGLGPRDAAALSRDQGAQPALAIAHPL